MTRIEDHITRFFSGVAVQERALSTTVSSVNDASISARADYRRRIQQRQTVIFGTIAAIMAVLLLFALLFWSGIVPFPFDKKFSEKASTSEIVTPCIAKGAEATELNKITVNVYNSTSISGIAGEASAAFGALGISVGVTENWNGDQSLSESARIQTGAQGINAAYTLAQYIPDSIIQYDPDMTGETVNVILGTKWGGLQSAESVASVNPDGTLSSAADCTKLDSDAGN